MRLKLIILGVLIVILAQILMLSSILSGNIKTVDESIASLVDQNRMLASEKTELIKKFDGLNNVIEMIPSSLLAGFEDPEAIFVEFLDYVGAYQLSKINGKVVLEGQSFNQTPIPLHESKVAFSFEFSNTYDAEKFIDYLLYQERFPLKVTGFSAKRSEAGRVGCDMAASLLIPARLQFTKASTLQQAEGK